MGASFNLPRYIRGPLDLFYLNSGGDGFFIKMLEARDAIGSRGCANCDNVLDFFIYSALIVNRSIRFQLIIEFWS